MQANEQKSRTSIGAALLAAVLFGVSTPLAKLLLVDVSPILLAGVLYAGSGIGLGLWLILRRWLGRAGAEAPLQRRDAIWLGGAVLAGGVPGPVLLMFGLTKTPASSASLLLNLEGALTAAIAWWVFRENVDRRVFAGMLAIVMGGALLAWNPSVASGIPWGALGIIGACLCWAID